jgi:23S rRNA pseudouridine1911/1915/1917 synthase
MSNHEGHEVARRDATRITSEEPVDLPQLQQTLTATPADAGQRLDQYLATNLADVSRARVQQLIAQELVQLNGSAAKPSYRLRGDETITILGSLEVQPLRAVAEEIPLEVLYEDNDLIVINKPAGMMVHAGAGATDDARNHGTLVNALLHRFASLSKVAGELRPGIVHRLDRETSGVILVAKNDVAHRKLGAQFSSRQVKKTYIALVHGWPKKDAATVNSPIRRDSIRRNRMTTRGSSGREAITHYTVERRIESPYGKFALLEVKIDTGRTHQIRVHLSSIGHPVVGDTVYGAPAAIQAQLGKQKTGTPRSIELDRNFLHAAEIQFTHPRTAEAERFSASLPAELEQFLRLVDA